MSRYVRAVMLAVLLQAPAFAADAPAGQALALELEFKAAFEVLMAGKLQTGLAAMEAALRRSQRELGEQAPHTLKVHDYYAATLFRLGRLAEAQTEFELILKRHRVAGSADRRDALSSLNNLANVVAAAQSPQAALPLFEQALAQRARTLGDDDLESCSVLADYAWALGEAGRLHESLPLAERALALRLQLHGERHSWSLTGMNNMAHSLFQLGRHADALALHERVLKLRLAESGERHPSTLVSMNNTALALRHMGRQEEALTLHQRAAALQTETLGPRHFSSLTGRRGVAGDLLALNRVDEATPALRALLDDSVQAYGPKHHHAQYTRIELGLALEKGGAFAEALAQLDAALAIYLETLGAEHFKTLDAGMLRARVLRRLGRQAEAASALRPLQANAGRLYGPSSELALAVGTELARNLAALGERAEAERLLADVVVWSEQQAASQLGLPQARRQQSEQGRQQLEAYRLRARLLAELGRLPEAFAMLEHSKARALLAQMSERETALGAGVTAAQWSELQTARERAHVLSHKLSEAKSPTERQQWLDQLTAAQLSAAEVQARLRLQYPRYQRVAALPVAGLAAAARLPKQGLFISFLLEGEAQPSDPQAVPELGAFSLDAKGRLQWHALGPQPGLADSIESLRLWSTQAQIGIQRRFVGDAGQALEILHWQQQGRPRWRVVPALGQHAAAARACPARGLWPPDCRPAGAVAVWSHADYAHLRRHLAAQLLQPMQARLRAHPQWIVSPDGALGSLPLDVLPWRGAELAARVAVSQLQSLSVLQALQDAGSSSRMQAAQPLALLAIGNPQFDGVTAITAGRPGAAELQRSRSPRAAAWDEALRGNAALADDQIQASSWPALPATQIEMERSAAAFRGQATRVLSGREASEARLRQASASGELAGARHLLLATHAWFDAERPDASMLVLRGEGPAPEEDGELSIGDIAGLTMNSRLAVLSACNTARSDARANEGQFGFAYALNIAGNQNALLTLWPVLDSAGADFVSRFFAHVARGRPHAQALQATKREFLHHPNPAWRAPRYWAGFVLFGV
ncbi:MAG: CHAT domain-containing protein [Paucibacter sp.]|nr:CHAT domain-containing protein [Roseateles sp.]